MPEMVSDLPYDFKKTLKSCDSLIFLGIIVRAAFLTNMCIVSDQTSEAGNVNYCSELHARSGLRFITRLQEGAWILPTRALEWAADPRKYGHPREGWILCSLELLTISIHEGTAWWCTTGRGSLLCTADKKNITSCNRSLDFGVKKYVIF